MIGFMESVHGFIKFPFWDSRLALTSTMQETGAAKKSTQQWSTERHLQSELMQSGLTK
jgi:hypothetical protein